jgi:hypothetical protein
VSYDHIWCGRHWATDKMMSNQVYRHSFEQKITSRCG